MQYKILNAVGEAFSEKGKAILAGLGQNDYLNLTQEELEDRIVFYDVLFVKLGLLINKKVIDLGKNLKVIASNTTGLNHIDADYAESRGIKVISLKGETEFLRKVYATAEHTFSLLLSLLRKVPWNFNSVIRDGLWDRDSYQGRELAGKTLGIIGFGRLGSRVAAIARGFEMNVLGYDPYVPASLIESTGARCADLDYLLKQSDIISVHVALTPETKGLVDGNMFSKMKDGAVLVNTSRGDLINEDALLEALKSGKISAAALDVLTDELYWASGIRGGGSSLKLIDYAGTHKNLLITSHLGGATRESLEKTEIFIAQKIKDYLLGNESYGS